MPDWWRTPPPAGRGRFDRLWLVRAAAVAARPLRSERKKRRCPSQPPRSTPRCWTRRSRRVRLPGDQRQLLADAERRARRASPRRARDGIVQVSTGGAEYAVRARPIKNMVTGAVALAAYAHEVAKNYPVNIALHTDHCPKDKLDRFVRPLLAISDRAGQGRRPAAVPVAHVGRLRGAARGEPGDRRRAAGADRRGERSSSRSRSASSAARRTASVDEINEKLYTTVEDGLRTVEVLGTGEKGRYITALTFGNVHGVYKPGAVKLRPEVLKEIQDAGRRQARQGAARSTSSSTAARARPWRRSGPPSTTA